MVQFIEHFQEVPDISRNSVERSNQDNVEAMSTGICKELVQAESFRFCTGNCVCIFMNNFISALLRQFAEVIKLCLCVLVAGWDQEVEGSNPFAPTTSKRVESGDIGNTTYPSHR